MLTAVTTSLVHWLCGKPLTIATADAAAIAALREGLVSELAITPPIHVSDHDAYLLVEPQGADVPLTPSTDAPALLLRALVVEGTLARQRGRVMLSVADRWEPLALVDEKPFDATLRMRRNVDLLPALNRLPFAHCSTGAHLFDRRGLDQVVRSRSFVGPSWAPELPDDEEADTDATWVWSRRTTGAVNVHLAVLGEYEERYALINPVQVRL